MRHIGTNAWCLAALGHSSPCSGGGEKRERKLDVPVFIQAGKAPQLSEREVQDHLTCGSVSDVGQSQMCPRVLECDQLPIVVLCWEKQEIDETQKNKLISGGQLFSFVAFKCLLSFGCGFDSLFDPTVFRKTFFTLQWIYFALISGICV